VSEAVIVAPPPLVLVLNDAQAAGAAVAPEIGKPGTLFKPNKIRYPAIIAAQNPIVEWTGMDAMDYDTIALTKLKEEEMRLRQHRPANEAMTPQIQMVVSNWYTDELGNQARFIKTRD
jgi:hypothetical protein